MTRKSKYRYFFSGALTAFLAIFSLLFLSLLVQQLAVLVAMPLTSPMNTDHNLALYPFRGAQWFIFKSLFWNSPYLYNLLYMLIMALGGGILALLAYALSLFLHQKSKLLVISLVPILYLLSALLLAASGHNDRVLAYYFDANIGITSPSCSYFLTVNTVILLLSLGLVTLRCQRRDELS